MTVLWLVAWAIAGAPAVHGWWVASLVICLWLSLNVGVARAVSR